MTQVQFERAFSEDERKVLTYRKECSIVYMRDVIIKPITDEVEVNKIQDEALGQNIDIFV